MYATMAVNLMDLIANHLTAAGFGGGVLIIALISCMPQNRPKTLDDWYAYIRHSLQTAIPAARHADSPQTKIQTTETTPDTTRTQEATIQQNPIKPDEPAKQ
jgi:hypothetical protein